MQSRINTMREEGLSPSSMKIARDIAAHVLEVALDKKILFGNPFKKIAVAEIPPRNVARYEKKK